VTGFHPLDGARYVRRLGQKRIAGLVAHHSGANVQAALRGLSAELAEFPDEASETTAALAYCDMLTGPVGEPVSLDERIADVERRVRRWSCRASLAAAGAPDTDALDRRHRGQAAATRPRLKSGSSVASVGRSGSAG
jgi:hypothetical protein